MEDPIIFNPQAHAHLIPSFTAIHTACIISPPYTIATFLPPLSPSRIETWWADRIAEEASGGRKIIIQIVIDPSTGGKKLAGYVMLGMPSSETGPFRGIVEKLLVSPEHRRKGIARRLMESLEIVARKEGRTLLLLDTETGSPAEVVYPKLGYIEIGKVPNYGISPADGSLKAGTFFYKNLASYDGTNCQYSSGGD